MSTWGEYVRLGFVVNHDSHGYMLVAEEPHRLLRPQQGRQARPLYALPGYYPARLVQAAAAGAVPAGGPAATLAPGARRWPPVGTCTCC